MSSNYPKLPEYGFSWRSILIEPIPSSGERIAVGAVVKGEDQALITAKLIPSQKLRNMYGQEFGRRIADALSICIDYAEKYYDSSPMSNDWLPPLEGFYLSDLGSSVAENIEEGLLVAAMYCSSFSVSLEAERLRSSGKSDVSAPKSWGKEIFNAVTIRRSEYASYFERDVKIRGAGVPLKFGFLSDNYAAQFDAVAEINNIQHALVRAQSKLWQLDRLRDEGTLFTPDLCELLLKTPKVSEASEVTRLADFIEELEYEAAKRQLGIFSTNSFDDAASHLIEKVA